MTGATGSHAKCPLLPERVSDWLWGWSVGRSKRRKEAREAREAELVKVSGAEDPAGVTALVPGECSRSCPGKASGMGWPGHRSLTRLDLGRVGKAAPSTSSHPVFVTFGELFLQALNPFSL